VLLGIGSYKLMKCKEMGLHIDTSEVLQVRLSAEIKEARSVPQSGHGRGQGGSVESESLDISVMDSLASVTASPIWLVSEPQAVEEKKTHIIPIAVYIEGV
jgi:hypothetical protein